MNDPQRKRQWWLIATAAVLAVLTLYYYTGSWVAVALLFAGAGAFLALRRTSAGKRSSHLCVRCGATLNPNARQCNSCGSASWTIRD
jgi:ribosomal protein L40E